MVTLKRRYKEFYNRGVETGLDPKTNAKMLETDERYEILKGKGNPVGTFRLSEEHRVAFTVNDTTREVFVFQVGGHYPPSKKCRVLDEVLETLHSGLDGVDDVGIP